MESDYEKELINSLKDAIENNKKSSNLDKIKDNIEEQDYKKIAEVIRVLINKN